MSGIQQTLNQSMLLKGEYVMQNLDLSPFYRSTVGFDRLFSLLDDQVPPRNKRVPAI